LGDMETYGVTGVFHGMAGRERALATLLDGVIEGTRSSEVLDILLQGLLVDMDEVLLLGMVLLLLGKEWAMLKAFWLGLTKKYKSESPADTITAFIDR
ncbi:MAG: hypothetical protein Q9180_009782, partial [Flavoplaca navasiana]